MRAISPSSTCARQPVLGNAEVHHPARQRSCLVDHDRVPAPRQVPCRRQAARARTDDEHALTRWRIGGDRPALRKRQVAQEALDCVDADRLVHFRAVTTFFTGVIADAPVHRGHGVVTDDDFPRVAVAAGLCWRPATPARSRPQDTHRCRAAGGPRRGVASCGRAARVHQVRGARYWWTQRLSSSSARGHQAAGASLDA